MLEKNAARDEEMKRLRKDGWALEDIGAKFGVSRERVRQIVGNGGWHRTKKQLEKQAALHAARREFAAQHPELTTDELAIALGLRYPSYVSKYWNGTRHAINGTDEMSKGFEMEEYVSEQMKRHHIAHRLTNSRPVDVVLDDGRTVEIRSRWTPEPRADSKNFYFFPMHRERSAGKLLADIYIFALVTDIGEPDLFIVPAEMLPAAFAFGFCWPHGKDRSTAMDWTQFYDRWDILRHREPTLWQGKPAIQPAEPVVKEKKSSAITARK